MSFASKPLEFYSVHFVLRSETPAFDSDFFVSSFLDSVERGIAPVQVALTICLNLFLLSLRSPVL